VLTGCVRSIKNRLWNLSVCNRTLGEHKSGQGIGESGPRALTHAQLAVGWLGERPDSATGHYCSKSSHTVTSPVSTKISIVRGIMTLFSWDVYISSLAGLCSLSWSFLLVITSFELSKLPPTYLSCLIANSK
jgi:hypothetical protein